MNDPLPKLPPEFSQVEKSDPEWWNEIYGPTGDGDPLEVDKQP